MCRHGDTVPVRVRMPANLTFDGRERWATKPIDRCIAPIVRELNAAGAYTRSSCCGHGKGEGSIELHDGVQVLIPRRAPHSKTNPQGDGVSREGLMQRKTSAGWLLALLACVVALAVSCSGIVEVR